MPHPNNPSRRPAGDPSAVRQGNVPLRSGKPVGSRKHRADRYPRAVGVTPPPGARPARPRSLWLSWVVKGVLALVIFVVGIEVGYQRARNRTGNLRTKDDPIQVADGTKTDTRNSLVKQEKASPKKKEDSRKARKSPKPVQPAKAVNPPKSLPPPKKSEEPPNPEKRPKPISLVKFDTHILPLFKARCIRCHGGRKTKGDLDMGSIATLIEGGESGPAIKPGNVEDSVVWHYIVTDKMPPGKKNKLTAQEKNLIREWIAAGAK
jgi:periplasmic protein TonB